MRGIQPAARAFCAAEPVSRLRFTAVIIITLLCASLAAWAQISEDTEVHITPRVPVAAPNPMATVDPALKTHTRPITREVDLVLVPVSVTDSMDRVVTGLEKHNFAIFEGGKKQEIRHLSSEDAPLSLGVIFDASGSMANKVDKAREAVVDFFKTANPDDEFSLITFANRPELLQDFTPRIADIQDKLTYIIPKGRTALLDAIYLGVNQMRQAKHQRKALLIISDGGDNHSRYTEGDIKDLVRESDVQIFAIGFADRVARTPEEAMGPTLLSEITDVTGGRTFMIDDANELPAVAAKIGMELRNQYLLAYRPTNPAHDGKWRKIKVKLLPPKGLPPLNVYAKTGYYAPQE